MSEIWCVISVKKSERSYTGLMRLVSYFMWWVIYFTPSVSCSMKLVSKYLLTAIRGFGRLSTGVDLQLESVKTL